MTTMSRDISIELSTTERAELGGYEAIIQRGLDTFVDVGNALLAIRRDRLYRATHSTFEAYCEQRWQMSYNYANRLITSSEVIGNLAKALPIGTLLPATESQARPLTALPAEQQQEVWVEAVATAPEGKVTAAHVEKLAQARQTGIAERLGLREAAKRIERIDREKREREERRIVEQDGRVSAFLAAIKELYRAGDNLNVYERVFAPEARVFAIRRLKALRRKLDEYIGILERQGEE